MPLDEVVWSRRDNKGTFDNGGYVKNNDIEVPTDLRIDGSFLIRVDTNLDYIPIVHWLIGDTMPMRSAKRLRRRASRR